MRGSIPRQFFAASVVGLVLLGTGCSVFNDNFRAVDPGVLYRAGQMGRAKLDAVIGYYDIKTVVNLRGAEPEEGWYRRELGVCEENGVTHVDLEWSMRRLPSPESLQRLLDVLDTSPKPILVHCQAGVHRAGTASAVYVLHEGGSIEDARDQFGLFFMDAPIGGVLDLYDGSKPFAQWVREDYPKLYASAD